MKIDHAESARLYCLFAPDEISVSARLESFRAQPFGAPAGISEIRNYLGAAGLLHGREKL